MTEPCVFTNASIRVAAYSRKCVSIAGVDFTSSPSSRKAITVANATLHGNRLQLLSIDRLPTFAQFDTWLAKSGPWVAGFDFPFGLPRELVAELNWPLQWSDLIRHVHELGRESFKLALNQAREARPYGSRYISRKGDAAAGSSSPMKLVNPPVGLMLFEGAPRLLRAGLSIIPCAPSSDTRIALEAYPGYLARQITRSSYKKDSKEGMSPARLAARELLINALVSASDVVSRIEVDIPPALRTRCINDGSGDALDAVICAIQAAQCVIAGDSHASPRSAFGIPAGADPLEGWIATVPAS